MLHGIVPLWEVFLSFILSSFVLSSCSSPDLSITITVIMIIHPTSMTCVIGPKLICSCLYLSIYPSDSPSIRPVCLVIYQAHFPFVLSQSHRFSQKFGYISYTCCSEVFGQEPVGRAVIYWERVRSLGLVLQSSQLVFASNVRSVA